jgi:dynein heavy chain
LEGYDKQLQEFEMYGDLQDIKRYLKKAEALHSRLEEAAERIEGFHTEEEAFDWDRSQYPLRNKLVKILDPYRNLYKTVVDFQSKHE